MQVEENGIKILFLAAAKSFQQLYPPNFYDNI
jgi:hypothetical protein